MFQEYVAEAVEHIEAASMFLEAHGWTADQIALMAPAILEYAYKRSRQ